MSAAQRLAAQVQAAWMARGPLAWALTPLSLLYATLARAHQTMFALGLRRVHHLPRPVIVIGNIIAGGAGKTPTAIATVRALQAAGERPGLVSRGYGRRDDGVRDVHADSEAAAVGDEPLLMHLRTGAPVVVGRDRVAAGWHLLRQHPETTVIVCDDGLQHARLARDIEVLVFDERGIGNGWWLPAGPLRDRPDRHADLVLYNAPMPSTARRGVLARRQLGQAVPLQAWWSGSRDGQGLDDLAGHLAGEPVLAVAGIAHPARFFGMLRAHGLQVDPCALDDHHRYTEAPWAGHPAPWVLLTEKDAVKLRPGDRLAQDPRLHVVTLDFEPDPEYHLAVQRLLRAARAARPAQESH
ncbi:tetraacyldisaccharide 4'-kinase [Caldimonas caldifontis]|uniref:Tetraacyldisaccharide 4'-kinase n=1 Tax=Caldimonas caldifontis TaxID=1452508 RepID=A0A2S5STA8_9BURK|nr:tetraacyldisaccharide 4'-kinase [Caldimonas caldifontis]PPE65939.1 tetraacyldisaccharide 4'-kinase [Caldimonas caldifontis]